MPITGSRRYDDVSGPETAAFTVMRLQLAEPSWLRGDIDGSYCLDLITPANVNPDRAAAALPCHPEAGGRVRPAARAGNCVEFLLLSVVSAVLAVATPVLAGRVVDAIVGGESERTVITLALLIAGDRGRRRRPRHRCTRWLSAKIGEQLILDLRTAVFDHVQRMPIAFFTRTRTGALVSRLNNDVIGAQRAFSDTFSGVVSNVVMLVLTLVVMLRHLLADHAAGADPAADLRAPGPADGLPPGRAADARPPTTTPTMSTQMTERFSAPGATLVKLFGRPAEESAEFAMRASRVRDIGVRTAMLQWIFVTALTLVSALALALVYGLGGYYALQGTLEAGAVVALALLLTRLYAPLTALANARVEVMGALVSFERVFEVLDLQAADRREAGRPARCRPGRSSVEFDDVASATRRRTRSRWPRWRRSPSSTPAAAWRCCTASRSASSRGRWWRWSARPGPASRPSPSCCRGCTTSTAARSASAGVDVRDLTFDVDPRRRSAWSRRTATCSTSRSGPTCCWPRPEATEDELWDALRRARLDDVIAALPDGLDTVVGERGLPALRRRAAAADDRPAAAGAAAGRDPGRGDRAPRLDLGGGGAGGAGRGAGGPDRDRDRAPAVAPSARPT